jgi:hypothetical protein
VSGGDLATDLAAYRDLWRAAPADLVARHGVAHRELAGGVCLGCASLSGRPILNHVLGAGLAAPAGEADLDAIQSFYDDLGAAYSVAVDHDADGLGAMLERRGFAPSRAWMTFRRDAAIPAPEARTDLRVEEAGRDRAEAFGAVVAAAFGLPDDFALWMGALVGRPGWTALLALDGARPVGAGALFVHGDAGWLGMGATLPSERGRGAQATLFAERLRRVTALGLREAITETGAAAEGEAPGPSYRNMLRVGFEERALRPNLSSPSP